MLTREEKAEVNQELVRCLAQATRMNAKPRMTPQEAREFQLLSQRIAILKTGEFSLHDLDVRRLREIETESGLEHAQVTPQNHGMTEARAKEVTAWLRCINPKSTEKRDESEGNYISRIGTYNSAGGTFVPTLFFRERLPLALAAHSPLYDADKVSVLNSENGRPIALPVAADIANVAQVVSESSDQSGNEKDIKMPGHLVLGAFTYRSPLWRIPLEAVQDVESADGVLGLFEAFVADRIARGVGADLMSGNGSAKPLGLLTQLAMLADGVGRVAAGSSANTGGAETGANSIGSADVSALFYSVPAPYRQSAKAAWIANDKTVGYLAGLVSKQGLPALPELVKKGTLHGKPVYIDNSCPDMASSALGSLLFGDWSYWYTRSVYDQSYLQAYWQAPNLVEKGLIALRAFCRYDGGLAYFGDGTSKSPIRAIQQSS